MAYIAFVLDDQSVELVKAHTPMMFDKEYCHHITISFGDASSDKLQEALELMDGGYASFALTEHYASDSVQCFKACLISKRFSSERKDGGTYHLTHSVAAGHKPVESNEVVGVEQYLKGFTLLLLSGTVQALH